MPEGMTKQPDATPVPLLRAACVRALVLAALWWILAGGAASSWIVGTISVALALWTSLKINPPGSMRFSIPGALGFFSFFVLQSTKGGIQVALMALRPRLDLQPAQLDIALRLQPGPGQFVLASTLSLMPGTLAMNVENDRLQLHVLDESLPIESEVRATEAKIARMLCQELR